jgi:hypothetical protein
MICGPQTLPNATFAIGAAENRRPALVVIHVRPLPGAMIGILQESMLAHYAGLFQT